MRAVLIVEDEAVLAKTILRFLSRSGYDVRHAVTAKDALSTFAAFQPDVVLLDYKLPDASGLELLQNLKKADGSVKFIFMTGHGSVEIAVSAMKAGAFDFISKPIVLEELKLLLDKATDQDRIEKNLDYFRKKQVSKGGLDAILGDSPAAQALRESISRLLEAEERLDGEAPPAVLVSGETGTGKQLVARALHFDGPRRSGPFIELNCAALPDQLVESELFGHERGAFTDAKERKSGLVEAADGGTLFLDEIGELPLGVQAKLLKFLEDQTIRRVGSVRDHKVNVRIVAATNRSLADMVRGGKFRSDLYYRLQMIEIGVPPLRQRGGDIPLLANHFLALKSQRYRRSKMSFSSEASIAMMRHGWPGNIRELRNVVERAVLMSKGDTIGAAMLSIVPFASVDAQPIRLAPESSQTGAEVNTSNGLNLTAVEKQLLVTALERAQWNVSGASRLLGVSRDTLRYRMEKFDLQKPANAGQNTA